MEKVVEGIGIREADDLGPVIARADHRDRAIEVNRQLFYRLTPEVQEFVLCHEVCHLRYEEYDEGRTTALAADLYLRRSTDPADRQKRERFLSYLAGAGGDYSNWWQIVIAAIPAAFSLGMSIYGAVKESNSGWYSWNQQTRRDNMKTMLTQAFEESRKSNERSAADILWYDILLQYDNKDNSLDKFLARSENAWVKAEIAKYEKAYGFGINDVTPIDWLAFPAVKIALSAAFVMAVILLVRKIKKNRK